MDVRLSLPASEDDLEYDFDDVTPQERADASDLLAGAGIRYRWDSGYVLRVADEDEDRADELFGHDTEEVLALAALRDAAAVLVDGIVDDDDVLGQLADATGVVTTADPPPGVNQILWSTAGYLARQLLSVASEEGTNEEDVTAAATALRAVLG
jgi:hypothetical protein